MDTETAAPDRRYIAGLDGLRGIAIAGVLLFHVEAMAGGFLGVDLFFVLSGFLITSQLRREIAHTNSFSLRSFLIRRIRRLAPALLVMVALVTVVVFLVGTPQEIRTTLKDGPWVQLNVVNWHLIFENAGYWDTNGSDRVFGHLWSIAVEEQFYLIWPLVLLGLTRVVPAVARKGLRIDYVVSVVAVILSLASLGTMVMQWNPVDPSIVYTGTITRAFSLFAGVFVACSPAQRFFTAFAGPLFTVLLAGAIVGLVIIWCLADGVTSGWLYHGGLFLHSFLAAALVGCVAYGPSNPFTRLLEATPLRWLGKISYSLYLWHWPVFVILNDTRLPLPAPLHMLAVLAVSMVLAAASTYLVEDPIRFRWAWAKHRTGFVVFVVSSLALFSLWFLLPQPTSDTVVKLTTLNEWTPTP